MNMRLRCMPVLALALLPELAGSAPVDFTGSPIECTDPAGAVVPLPCAAAALARPDGYAFVGYSFNFIIPPPPIAPPPLPFPQVAQNDSERNFVNPVLQDLIVRIFGNTQVDVFGAPVLFFVNGTLDGEIVVNYSVLVSGTDNDLSWDFSARVDDVPAGEHTLDMHFGVVQQVQQQSQVNVASLYQVTVHPVAEPTTWLLLAAAGAAAARRRRTRIAAK